MVSSFVLGLYELSSMMTSSPSVRTVLRSIVGRDSSGSQIHGFGVVVDELVANVVMEVELVCAVVVAVELVVVDVTVELGEGSGTRVFIAPKRSDLMNFMQYPNDPTLSGLVHSVFISFASFDASVIFLQSFSGFRSPHFIKDLFF